MEDLPYLHFQIQRNGMRMVIDTDIEGNYRKRIKNILEKNNSNAIHRLK